MKTALAALSLCVVAMGCASTPSAPPAAQARALEGAWTFDFDAGPGIAVASLRDASGRLLARVSCQSPRGPLQIADWSFGDRSDPAPSVEFRLGAAQAMAPGRIMALNGAPALTFALAPSEPVFQAITPNAPVSAGIVGGPSTAWPGGSAGQINTVINACVARGS